MKYKLKYKTPDGRQSEIIRLVKEGNKYPHVEPFTKEEAEAIISSKEASASTYIFWMEPEIQCSPYGGRKGG